MGGEPRHTRTTNTRRPNQTDNSEGFTKPKGFALVTLSYADDSCQCISISPNLSTPLVQKTFGIYSDASWHYSFLNHDMIQASFTNYSLKQGLNKWKEQGERSVMEEMLGMHTNEVFEPQKGDEMTYQQKRLALRAIIFMKQKRCGRIKTRLCADGRPQHEIYSKEDAASPTVKTKSVLLTAVIEAMEQRFVAVADIPQAFLKAFLSDKTINAVGGSVDRHNDTNRSR